MWHPFALFPDELTVPAPLRAAPLPAAARLVYREKVVRWFKPKPGHTYKQPVLDHGPGLTLERRPAADGRLELRFRQERTHESPQVLEGTMTCAAGGWSSPLAWSVRQSFVAKAESDLLPSLEETGEWSKATVTRRTRARGGRLTTTHAARALLSPPAWLAAFPRDLAPAPWSDDVVVMDEFTLFVTGAAIEPAGRETRAHILAQGLRGHVLRYAGGLPLEFWVNEHGTVVYLCAGPTRVLVLESAEALT